MRRPWDETAAVEAGPAPVASPIGVCVYVFFPAGGIGRYTNEWMRALYASEEVAAEVVCSPDFQWKQAGGYPAWTGLMSLSHPVPAFRRARFLAGQFVNPRRGIAHAAARGAGLLHFANINHLSFPSWRGALKASGVRVCATVHDVKRPTPILSRRWEDRQLKAFYRTADALFVHANHQADELIAFAGIEPEKIHVVPHGPYAHGPLPEDRGLARARWGLPVDRQVALFFGQIREEKNLDRLIDALARCERRPHLVVAGAGGSRERQPVDFYHRRAREAGVEDRVTFIARYLADEEVGELFAASDWVALPYRSTFTSQSGVLNVAANYERPVLAGPAPVLTETVAGSDIGVVCAGDTAEAIAEGIDRLCRRVEAGYRHGFAAYRDRYSWAENVRRTLSVYKQLVGA
jgi:glycosyltransferase involved in cell wall biosynthesis